MQQTSQCVASLAPDYTKITDIEVRKALAYAYPYEDVWIAGGEVPGVTRVPASSVMPPGMAGGKRLPGRRRADHLRPGAARELLAEAGYGDEPYPITMVYYERDPQAAAAQDQITKGFEAGGFSVKAIPVQESPYSTWLDPDDEVNQTLNVRGANWCPAWPAGTAMLPPLLRPGAAFNTARFDEASIEDGDGPTSPPCRSGTQADAWGALDRDGS